MKICIHRGNIEIGGSCVELSTENSRILIDFGIPLLDKAGNDFDFNKYKSSPLEELVKLKILPDINNLYNSIEENTVNGILISHAHLDHYGLSDFIRKDIPFYLGEATLELINISNTFTNSSIILKNTVCFKTNNSFLIGDFKITPYLNDHSAFDAYSFLIEAEDKKIFYSGDFRRHGRKSKAYYWFKNNVPKNIDYLIMEGTNIGQLNKQTITEKQIEDKFVRIFKNSNKPNLIYTSGQNIDRLVTIFRACRRSNKLLVIDFYIAAILKQLSKYAKLPFPDSEFKEIRVIFPFLMSNKFNRENNLKVLFQFKKYKITKEEISNSLEKLVMIVRPSMKIDLERIKNLDGGNLIYSLWDGYINKEYTKTFIDYLVNYKGFSLIKIHSSGHANPETLKEFVKIVNPKSLIPIHTMNADMYKKLFYVHITQLKDGEYYQL